MASRKKLLAEGKKRLNEKLASVEEQANYMHRFIDDIVLKPCADARTLISKTDKSFLKHYSKANQELEACLDTLFLIQASLPGLNNGLDTDCSDDEESVSETLDGQCLIDNTTPVVDVKTKTGSASVESKTPCVDDVGSVSSDRGASSHGVIGQKEIDQRGSVKIDSVSEVQRSIPSIKSSQSISVKEQWFEVAERSAVAAPADGTLSIQSAGDVGQSMPEIKQLVMSSSSLSRDTSSSPVSSTQHHSNVGSNFMHGMKYQPDTISTLLQQSAQQPRIPNTTFAEGTVLEVLVTEVISPSLFWIQPVYSPLAALMQKISLVYSEGKGQMVTFPVIGMACCSCFTQDNCWYRARIIDIFPSGGSSSEIEVKVVYVDFGNCEGLPLNRLRYLLPELAVLPAQAVCAGLAKVKPPCVKMWEHEQTMFFVKLVVKQKLTAKVSLRTGTQAPLVDLTYDLMANQAGNVFSEATISPTIKINVAELLIENGHATRFVNTISRTSSEEKCKSPTDVTPNVMHNNESPPATGAPEYPTTTLSPKTRARHLCERLRQEKESVVHDSKERSAQAKDKINMSDHPVVCPVKVSRSSSGVSSATNLSCHNKSPDDVRLLVDGKHPFKIPNIPRMDVGIGTFGKKEESDRRGRGRGRGKHRTSSKSISDASSEDSIPTGLASKRNIAPRIPNFQRESATRQKSATVKETKPVTIPLLPSSKCSLPSNKTSPPSTESSLPLSKSSPPSSKSSSPRIDSPKKSPEVAPLVKEPTSLAERKEKLEAGECVSISASYIVSPSEFYSHIISCDSRKIDYLMDELNEHMGTSSSQNADGKFEAAAGTICCAKYSEDDRWYRVEILEVERRKEKHLPIVYAHIYYVDFGNMEWVPESELCKLESWFFDLPPQVIRCSLAHVHPKKRQEKKDGATQDGWSREDINKFVELAGYLHRLSAKIISTEMKSNMKSYNVIISSVIDGKQTCINDRMVTLGHGESEVFSTQCDVPVVRIEYKDLAEQIKSTATARKSSPSSEKPANETTCLSPESAALDVWNPMTEDFVSQRNAYNIDVDDPGMATVGYKTENVHKICKFYANGDICYQGSNCKFLHSTELGRETVDAYWSDNPMPLPAEGSCVAMQIKAYHSACHFWAQLPYGAKPLEEVKVERGGRVAEDEGETLQSLVDSINHIYGKSSHSTHTTDLLLKADGELVCAKSLADSKWYRARVTSTNADENTIKVFYLDYGNSEVVPESSVRPMLPQFLHLPFQAVECFLYQVTPKEVDGAADKARRVMEELTADKMLVALVKSSMASGTLHVVLIDTSGPGDLYIHQELIDREVAVSTPYDNRQLSKKKFKKLDPYANGIPG